ncbi:hypothetical protein FTX61_13640 [Nitriliruptoraceae bacterium ZYF776]|nr:hypothetical protein [Profundirhabdus halotolerans]
MPSHGQLCDDAAIAGGDAGVPYGDVGALANRRRSGSSRGRATGREHVVTKLAEAESALVALTIQSGTARSSMHGQQTSAAGRSRACRGRSLTPRRCRGARSVTPRWRRRRVWSRLV